MKEHTNDKTQKCCQTCKHGKKEEPVEEKGLTTYHCWLTNGSHWPTEVCPHYEERS